MLVALFGLAAILASQTTHEGVSVPAVPRIDEATALRSLQARGLVPAARYDPEAVATARLVNRGLVPAAPLR